MTLSKLLNLHVPQCPHLENGDDNNIYFLGLSWEFKRSVYILSLLGTGMGCCGSAGKESACSVGDLGSIPGLGRSPGEGKGYPLQYSDLENSVDCMVHGVAKNWTQLSNFHWNRHERRLINTSYCYFDDADEITELDMLEGVLLILSALCPLPHFFLDFT